MSYTISSFYDIKITMDIKPKYNKPYFVAEYSNQKIFVDILECEVISGEMDQRGIRLSLGWCALYKDELMKNWELINNGENPRKINPLRR